jgi:hypothetical protein
MAKFVQKLEACSSTSRPISIVVSGGSVTAGAGEIPTSHLTEAEFEALYRRRPVPDHPSFGSYDKLATKFHKATAAKFLGYLLQQQYPKCNVDTYNLAKR